MRSDFTADELRELDQRLASEFGEYYSAVIETLAKHDLMDLACYGPGQYHPEARAVLPLVPLAANAADLAAKVRSVFREYFDADPRYPEELPDIGPIERYEALAIELLQRYAGWKNRIEHGESPAR